jgi:DNA-binding XRE family transcriptional regulator
MSREKTGNQPASRSAAASPAAKIVELRNRLGLERSGLAEKLDVTRIAVLHWENGERTPSRDVCLRLAILAKSEAPSLAQWFLTQAGFDLGDLAALVPGLEKSFKKFTKHQGSAAGGGDVVRLPILKDPSFAASPGAVRDDGLEWMPIAVRALGGANPASCSFVRVPSEHGLSFFGRDEFVVVDGSQTDLSALKGKLVLAYSPKIKPDAAERLKAHSISLHVYLGWVHAVSFGDKTVWLLTTLSTPEQLVQSFSVDLHIPRKRSADEVVSWFDMALSGGWALPFDARSGMRVLGRAVCWLAIDKDTEEKT